MSLDITLYFDVPESGGLTHEVFDYNITHNLSSMASAQSEMLYKAIWRPKELFDEPRAKDIVNFLKSGLLALRNDQAYYTQFEPVNKWGTYIGFVEFLEEYLEHCEKYPEAKISVSR